MGVHGSHWNEIAGGGAVHPYLIILHAWQAEKHLRLGQKAFLLRMPKPRSARLENAEKRGEKETVSSSETREPE